MAPAATTPPRWQGFLAGAPVVAIDTIDMNAFWPPVAAVDDRTEPANSDTTTATAHTHAINVRAEKPLMPVRLVVTMTCPTQ